jgi:hypothetical protein
MATHAAGDGLCHTVSRAAQSLIAASARESEALDRWSSFSEEVLDGRRAAWFETRRARLRRLR